MLYRIGYNLFLIASILFLPWYVYVVFILAGLYLFENFFEAILFAVVVDVTYTYGNDTSYWFTAFFTVSYALVAWSKTKISYYD